MPDETHDTSHRPTVAEARDAYLELGDEERLDVLKDMAARRAAQRKQP